MTSSYNMTERSRLSSYTVHKKTFVAISFQIVYFLGFFTIDFWVEKSYPNVQRCLIMYSLWNRKHLLQLQFFGAKCSL